ARSVRRFPILPRLPLLVLLALAAASLHAEPYIAVQQGFKCSQCHVNPTGGGLRNTFGDVFAQTLLPMAHIDTGQSAWTGAVDSFLRIGGDLRYDWTATQVRHQPSVNQLSLEQTRVYLDAEVIPERLLVYVDEQVAPGGATNEEAYALYWSANHDWYVKAGQMYLPFGFRLQDQTAYVQQISGINMTAPDRAVEAGYLQGSWDAQLDVSNGTAGGPVTSNGKQFTGQLSFVRPLWRAGLALDLNNAGSSGRRTTYGLFGGLKTGPVAWLAEADLAVDHTLPNGGLKTAGGLLEADWLISRGQNLKLTAEQLAPDLAVTLRRNGQTRWSLVYELTPIQFVQLRAGVRYYDGIPQSDAQHERLYFIQLHGFF
ncbi:MAG: hypothetical protein ACREUG_16100, partial [Steroidobacteraceae bacterium]